MTKKEIAMYALTGLSCAAAVVGYIQHKKTASLLKKTVSEVAGMTPVEIEKDVVDQVVHEALEMKVDNQVDDILDETRKDMDQQIRMTVKSAVSEELDKASEKVSAEFEKQLANITVEDVRDILVDNASDLIEDKLKRQMDDILKQYQKRLDTINDMYVKMMAKAPNLAVTGNVNPGIHVNW